MDYCAFRFRSRTGTVHSAAGIAAIAAAFSSFPATGACVLAQSIDVLGPRRALSMTILRIQVPQLPDQGTISVEIKGPADQDYHALDLFNDGHAIRGEQFGSTSEGELVAIVPVFLAGGKELETARHPFGTAGHYLLRLRRCERPDGPVGPGDAVLFETALDFAEPAPADEEYFALARDPRVAGLLDLHKRGGVTDEPRTLPGLALIAHIVESTRHETDPTHGRSEWAAPLSELALAVPDSSYAPYLAYYAACSYMWQRKNAYVKKEHGYELPDPRVAQLEYYKRAREAIEFAVAHGDSYIKPFATLFLAAMKAWAADYAGALKLTESVGSQAEQSPQIVRGAAEVSRFVLSRQGQSRE